MWKNNAFLSLLWTLVCVVGILILAYWATKYIASHGGGTAPWNSGGSEQFRVVSRLNLGKDQYLVLTQMGSRYFLLGVTAGQITNLAELTQQEAEQLRQESPKAQSGGAGSFGQALKDVLEHKDRRCGLRDSGTDSFGQALHRMLQQRNRR